MIARFAAFENVSWNLGLEYSEYRDPSWVVERARFVKEVDPYDHLLGVHQVDDDTYDFPGEPNLDHTSLQRLGAEHDRLHAVVLDNRRITIAAGRPVPICHEEFFIEGTDGTVEQFTGGIWAIVLAGGYFKAASLGWWTGTPYSSATHFRRARHLYEVMTELPFWDLEPADSIVDRGYAARVGSDAIVVYLPDSGPVTADLSGRAGAWSATWIDPVSGVRTQGPSVTAGGITVCTPPAEDDRILLLRSE
jgi:hypothetical protein